MLLRLEILLVLNFLKIRGPQGLTITLSAAGIALGVVVLIVVKSVMNGFHQELLDKAIGMSGHIKITGIGNRIADYPTVVEKLEEIISEFDGIESISTIIEAQSIVSNQDLLSAALINGVTLPTIQNNLLVMNNIIKGDTKMFEEGTGIMMGQRLAESLRVTVGDKVSLLYKAGHNRETIIGTIPRTHAFTVSGIFDVGFYEYDRYLIYTPIEKARKLFHYPQNSISKIEINLADPMDADFLQEILYQDTELIITSWKDMQHQYIEALKTESRIMSVILAFIIAIASFNLVSGLNAIVNNHKGNIAILRTLGMSKFSIMMVFIICGSIIGVLGAAFGSALGILLAHNIGDIYEWVEYILNIKLISLNVYSTSSGLPSIVRPQEVLSVAMVTALLSFLATIYPAIRASRQDPASILRYKD